MKKLLIIIIILALAMVGCDDRPRQNIVNAEDADLDVGRAIIECEEIELEGAYNHTDCSNRVEARDYEVVAPDSIRVLINTDGHPTMNRICFDGIAFLTVSTTHSGEGTPAYQRVPEWDDRCPTSDRDDLRDQTESP